jgi:hypothetical protein
MLLKDIRDQIAGNLDRWEDTELRRRCEDLIISTRAKLIKQNVDKYNITPNNFIEQINCMPTTKVDISECCSVDLGCDVTRTLNKVPDPIRIRNRNSNFKYVGTIDSKTSYSFMSPKELEDFSTERFFNNVVAYNYINGYIYIYGDNPQNIRVQGVFGDPRDVANLNDCDNPNEDCVDNIDINDDLVSNIRLLVMDELNRDVVNESNKEVKLDENE